MGMGGMGCGDVDVGLGKRRRGDAGDGARAAGNAERGYTVRGGYEGVSWTLSWFSSASTLHRAKALGETQLCRSHHRGCGVCCVRVCVPSSEQLIMVLARFARYVGLKHGVPRFRVLLDRVANPRDELIVH